MITFYKHNFALPIRNVGIGIANITLHVSRRLAEPDVSETKILLASIIELNYPKIVPQVRLVLIVKSSFRFNYYGRFKFTW